MSVGMIFFRPKELQGYVEVYEVAKVYWDCPACGEENVYKSATRDRVTCQMCEESFTAINTGLKK